MTEYRAAIVCPVASSNDLSLSVFGQPDNLTVPLSATGTAPVTHLGCSGQVDDLQKSALETQTYTDDYAIGPQNTNARTQFFGLMGELGLQIVQVDE